MKKISTLALGLLVSAASFAAFAPSRLTVSAEGNTNIKVTVDGNRFSQQSFSNSAVFENLEPGFHSVKVYQLNDKRFGFFGRKRGDEYKLLYTASVNIKPLFATSIQLNRFGNARIDEQPMRGAFNNKGWDGRGGYDDHSYNDNRNNGYGRENGYVRIIKDEDFFAAQRVMQRENFDDARLLYAKRLVDENMLCAEQVKELARFFSFDNSRLDFAKYAYSHTTDKGNFSVVCNAFSSNMGRDQMMGFIRSCR
ncbi:MAG: DUF4476 domain-containing protein [Chitinophagaceae bacterium]